MKKLLATTLSTVALVTVMGCVEDPNIQDNADYKPSTDIYYGIGNVLLGNTAISGEFQLNLQYSDLAEDADVDAFNNFSADHLNWLDPEEYVFAYYGGSDVNALLDVSTRATVDGEVVITVTDTAQWTITGWNHTVLHGSWEDTNANGVFDLGDFLRVDARGYHSFGAGANDIEIWETAYLPTEVVGYTLASDETGSYLQVVPADDSDYDLVPGDPI